MSSKKPSIAVTHSSLLLEWDYRKNQLLGLDPEKLSAGSNKKVWWVCGYGHSWPALINNRARLKKPSDCPYCSGQKAGYGNDLLTNHPELCEEWDYEKNKLGPESYLPKSNKKVWWKCEKGHNWPTIINDRVRGNGCPFCSGRRVGYGNDLLTNYPELCQEWDYEKNKLGPENFTPGSNKKGWWKCSQGHSWPATICDRVLGGTGCPYCSGQKAGYGNDLLTNHPELCEEWDYEKNKLGPENYLPGSEKKVWWVCSKGHSWPALIYNRARKNGNGCPYCSGQKAGYGNDLLTNRPELCQEWDYEKNKLGPEKFLPGSNKKVWWVCSKGHSWPAIINNRARFKNSRGCPECSVGNMSRISQEWLDSLGVEQREIQIGPYRVDGFDPETNTVYEFLGDFWHGNPKIFPAQERNPVSKKSFGQLYRETKRRIFRLEKMGYRVVYIWESDFYRGENK